MKHLATLFLAMGIALPGTTAFAQFAVTQQTSNAMNAEERANLQLAHDFWRDIINGGNLAIASHYMPADFISRNPNIAAGRDAFIDALRNTPKLLQNVGQRAPEVQFAEGPYVFLVWANFDFKPTEPYAIFKYNTMDLLRIEDGKVVEHWDGASKVVTTGVGPKSMGGGVYINSTGLSPRERETHRLGVIEFKDIIQNGHYKLALEHFAPGYIQHNPNVPGGRDGFIKWREAMKREPLPIREQWVTPPTLELVTGNFYLKFDQRFRADPANPAQQYAYYRFDMVRVDDGLIQEHWDVASPNALTR